MKRLTLLLIIITFTFSNCSTINQRKFKNKENTKDFISKKYGIADNIENSNGLEIWTYNHKGIIKSDRKVTFNDNNEIIENKKYLSPISYIVKYVVVPIGVIGLATVTYFLTTDGSILIF